MSSIGMETEVTSHDEMTLVSVDGGGGFIGNCDGDLIMAVTAAEINAVAQVFPLVVKMFRKGEDAGERSGKHYAQCDMRKALGL